MYFKSLSDHTSMLAFSTFNVYMAQDLTLPLSLNVDICIIIKNTQDTEYYCYSSCLYHEEILQRNARWKV